MKKLTILGGALLVAVLMISSSIGLAAIGGFVVTVHSGSGVSPAPPPLPAAPTLASYELFGGSGDQRGLAIAIDGSAIYAAGYYEAGPQGLLVRYDTPLTGPVWDETLAAQTYFLGTAATASTVYPVGVAVPGACGASDGVGDTEGKSLFARYSAAGIGLGCSSVNYFPYRGGESYSAARTVVESGTPFIYATGRAEQTGFGFSLPFILAKYNTSGTLVSAVTEPGITLGSFSGCCPGESDVSALTEDGGFLYLAGFSRLPGFGEDNNYRPVLMKYDTSLARQWKRRPGDVLGHFRGVTTQGGFIYAVGNTNISGPNRQFLVEKYDDTGARQWSMTSGGANDDVLTGVVPIGSRIFAVGYTYNSTAGGADAVVLEIDPATGAALSTTMFGGAQDDFANGVATDGTDLYVVGESRSYATVEGNAVGQNDVLLLRYTLNQDPTADAGDDQQVEAGAGCEASVELDGTGSSDPDAGDMLTYTWTGPFPEGGGTVLGSNPSVTLPLGSHVITLTVDDGNGGSSSDQVTIDIVDTTAPSLTVAVSPNALWVPNHRLVTITATIGVGDTCDTAPAVTLVSITSSEPDNGPDDGDTANDIQGAAFGTDDRSFLLRSERAGNGSGRTYVITYRARDASGNETTTSALVTVPLNR